MLFRGVPGCQKHLYGVFEKIRSVPGLKKIYTSSVLVFRFVFLFIFSSFWVLLKTVSINQMASVVYEVLFIGLGFMIRVISAPGVTSVI